MHYSLAESPVKIRDQNRKFSGEVLNIMVQLFKGGGGGGGGGVQGQKSWKHDFEITGDPKGPPTESTFWSGFEAPDS